MDSERINVLLDKYWKCETSVEEEHELQAYFRQTANVPESLKETASLFAYFDEQRSRKLTDISFDKTVMKKVKSAPRGKMATLVYNAMRIAAGIVVLVLAVWLVRIEVRKASPAESEDTYNDPQIAFEETKKALMMISRSFGTAEEQARKINVFNEAKEELMKQESPSEL